MASQPPASHPYTDLFSVTPGHFNRGRADYLSIWTLSSWPGSSNSPLEVYSLSCQTTYGFSEAPFAPHRTLSLTQQSLLKPSSGLRGTKVLLGSSCLMP